MSTTPKTRVRFGLVGCGVIGPTHAAAIKQLSDIAQLVAVADVIPERAKALGEKFGVTKIYATDDALIADPDVDAVAFCTPSGLHADGVVKALRGGKHAIVEKPMDVSLAGCDRMISAERETGRKLAVISQHRFDAATVFVKDAVASGRLGDLVLVDMSVKWYRTQDYYDSGDWRGTWALDGGGCLMNQGVHTVDLLQYLGGPVERIHARMATAAHARIEVEDVVVASLKFKSGAIGTLTASTSCFSGQPARIDLYGTAGSAIIEGDRLKYFRLTDGTTATAEEASRHAEKVASGGTASVKNDGETRLEEGAKKGAESDPGAVWGDAHAAEFRDFILAINTNSTPLIHGAEGRKPLEIIMAVYESARSGREVVL